MAWAKRNKIDYPSELEKQILLNGHKMDDWQSSYENLKKRYADIEKEVTVLNSKPVMPFFAE